ncbi:MAG: hypothetical protein ACRDE7_00605, partial [Sphingobacterium sp.]
MKNILLVLTGILISGCLLAQETTYYVAVNGSDKGLGTISSPFKTLEHALNSVSSSPTGKVNVFLTKGRYLLEKTLLITADLLMGHELHISALDNQEVILSGTTKLTPKWEPHQDEIVRAYIGKGKKITQLFLDGHPLRMARYPNYDN